MGDEPVMPLPEEEQGVGGRAASVVLRTGEEGQSPEALLDPAHQSLADALRVTLRFVQLGMVALGVLFLFSGATTVREGESGLRLMFGKIVGDDLEPGFHFSAPYPVGDLIKIETGTRRINEDEAYWPFLTEREKGRKIEELSGGADLDPRNDGALITADGNLVHTQWRVIYRRQPELARQFAENIHPDHEERIVRGAAQHGIVRAVSEVTIDELLKETGGGAGSVASRARAIAQEMLDDIRSGIVLEDLVLSQKMPPLFARERFNAVQSAESNAQKAIETARQAASRTLSEAAGGVYEDLRREILNYEEAVAVHAAAIEAGDPRQIEEAREQMDAVLARIDALMESDRAGGEVARLMFEARAYREEEPNRRLADARRFEAMLAQYEANPSVTVQTAWADAWSTFVARDMVEIIMQPVGAGEIELMINRDPAIRKRQEEALKAREVEEAEARRRARQEKAEFKTATDLIESEG